MNNFKELGAIVFPPPRLPIVLYWNPGNCELEPGVFAGQRGYYAVDHGLPSRHALYAGRTYKQFRE